MAECSKCGSYTKYNGGLCSSCYAKSKNNKNQNKFSVRTNKPEPTPEAIKLAELLREKGWKVELEKFDGYKHIDIAIVKAKVNIEVDGKHHHGKSQALRDLKRTFYSWNKDYVTLRIPNILTSDEKTIHETAEYINEFLKKGRTKQLEEEIKKEQKEDYPFWDVVSGVANAVYNAVDKFLK